MNLNHNLILDNTDLDDSGQYICRAVLNNETVEQNIRVTVVPGKYGIYNCRYIYAKSYDLSDRLSMVVLARFTQRCSSFI